MTEPYPIATPARNAERPRATAKMPGNPVRLDVMLRALPGNRLPLARAGSVETPEPRIVGRVPHGQVPGMFEPFASIIDRPYATLEAQPDRCAYPWRGAPDGVAFEGGRFYGCCSCACGCRKRERKYFRCAGCAHGRHFVASPLPIPVAIRAARAFGEFDHGPGTAAPLRNAARPAPLHRRDSERAVGSPSHAPYHSPSDTRRTAAG
jgi:hypothetical protein